MSTMRGECCSTSRSRRARAVAVVSPGMPALMTGRPIRRESWEG
ncbi:MAG TPA: hypothetical protein PLQ15_04700 [Syntrophales bacterium]|nr:hypothetical protein [Syntrophales bacterium]